MLEAYLPIAVLAALAVGMAAILLLVPPLVAPSDPSERKLAPYECGVEPVGSARIRFPAKFALIAMLFIVFDVEAAFFYPWAVAYRDLGLTGLVAMFTFILVLLVGYVYAWKKGALQWE
ncbi:MAG: NADH-quinone oxidoreductase subunit A [Chloroflexi bacterium]|nr:NADH-quinone oxidoreductase subunit A [Chloroflexota bacterium]MBI4504336.1 NADH-quinone oxidoreductase subunit A [Chloroflexota bacterium]